MSKVKQSQWGTCKAIITFHVNLQRVAYLHSLDTKWIVTNGPGYTNSSLSTVLILNHCYETIGYGNPNRQNLVSQRCVVLLFKTWCNRHNVKQMNQRDAWDIIPSTFNNEILETLNQWVAIHLEDANHLVVDVWEFSINQLIPLLMEISPVDMSDCT